MKKVIGLLLLILLLSCNAPSSSSLTIKIINQTELTNPKIKAYTFLDCMYGDSYFPTFLVDKCKVILLNLCGEIEATKPKELDAFYKLTHAATNQLNGLEDEFFENNSEIETAARECLAINFEFIAVAYGFNNADIEELIATRDW